MNKIFILVIILVLVGCQPKNETQIDNTEVLEQIDTLASNLEQTFYSMNLDFKDMQDRLDTIEESLNKLEYLEDAESEFYWIEDELESLRQWIMEEPSIDNYYSKVRVVDYVDEILQALLVDTDKDYYFTYIDNVLCNYEDGELDWCLTAEQLVEEDLG
jgi:uncharacterized protein YpuA (DUF1002 family)